MDGKGKSFIKGAAILTAAGFIARLMGFVYRVILTRIIGAEGMGLYQMAYPIYTILLVVSRSGIPVALAKLIADRTAREKENEAFKIFKVARSISLIVGLFFSLLMAFLAKPIIVLLGLDPRAYYAVLAISPAIFFVSIMATYRGFFQGLQTMVPTAYSQIVEQLIRMITMIGLVIFLARYSLEYAAAGASFGAVTGAFAGLLTLIFIYYKRREENWVAEVTRDKYISIVRQIAVLGIPITFGALVQPLMNLVDLIFVPQRLKVAGYVVQEATTLYGQLSAVAMPLVNFPTIITVSLAASLVPSMSEAFALHRSDLIKKRTETALRLTVLIALPSSVGLFILARPLTTVVFSEPAAAVPLKFVAWGVLFIALQNTSSAILQGMGRTTIPARNLIIGAVTNGVINYTLTGIPRFGIKGAAIGTTIGFAVAALLNLIYVKAYTLYKFNFKVMVLKPVSAVILMGVIVNSGFILLMEIFKKLVPAHAYSLSTFIIVIIAILVYGLILLLLREICYSDLMMVPVIGKKLADNLRKLGLVGDK